MALLINRAKQNPAGKDRVSRTLTPAVQLAAEWVDVKNGGTSPINLNGVELYHYAYLANGGTEWEKAIVFSGALGAGMTVRVHSGNPIPLVQMNMEDRNGADHHVFTGKNYIWNNTRPEFPRLWYTPSRQWLDETSYDVPVPEGKILIRVGVKLI